MGYRIRETGEYIATDFGLRDHFKGIAGVPLLLTPEWLNENGVDPVFEGPQASGGTVYQYSQFAGVEQIEGKWYTKYILGPVFTDTPEATAAQQEAEYKARRDAEQAKSVRSLRNAKLAETDWVTLKAIDASTDGFGIQLPQVWMDYRKVLRDVPTQAGFPWTVDWPVAP